MPSDPTKTNPFLRKVLDAYNGHRIQAFDAFLTEDCVLVRNGVEARGREEVKRVFARLFNAFPDIEYRIDDAVSTSNRLVIRWHGRGTHRGEYLGLAPTGASIAYDGLTFYELRGEQIARAWVSADQLGVLRTLSEAARTGTHPEAHPH